MTAPVVYDPAAAASLLRTTEGLGLWPYRGQVAAVGIGHSPTMRRWDGRPETSVGAWSILAIRRAIEDAGVPPDQVDGLALVAPTSSASPWPADAPVPEDFRAMFAPGRHPLDGVARLSPEWLLNNMPELTNVKFAMIAPQCMSMALAAAIEAVGRGLTSTCVVVRSWHNFPGRYRHGGENAEPTVSGAGKHYNLWTGPGGLYRTAMQFQRYLHKYGKTHDMMAPFIVNSRRNGLLFPEGYWAQHRPTPLTTEDYLSSRWIQKPANLLDNDLPIHTAGAYLVTTAERAKDLRQPPVYVLGHAGAAAVQDGTYGPLDGRGVIDNLEEAEEFAAATARKVYEAAGISASDLTFENCYDGFSLFHVFHIEGFGFAGIKRGEALDLFQTDISIEGPNPVSPSGGNIGSGRSRFWMFTDSIQQLQGRAGARQITREAQCGIAGGFYPALSHFIVWSKTPE
jgi:acetyl-CoA acetyltransferase